MELDLLDGLVDHAEHDRHEPPQRAGRVDVGGRVVGEDVDQLAGLAQQLAGAELRAGLAQEVLLAGRPHEVVVGVAVPDVVERLVAAHLLVARLDVDHGVVLAVAETRVVVEVAPVYVHIDAAERVHTVPEPAEADVHVVVDREARELLDGLDREPRAAERVGDVDPVRAVTGDVHLQIARQRHQRDPLARVDAHQDDRVGAWLQAELLVAVAAVRACDQDRLRLATQDRGELVAGIDARELLDGLVEEEKRARRGRAGGHGHDDQGGEQGALEHQAMRRCGSPVSRFGINRTKSTSVCL